MRSLLGYLKNICPYFHFKLEPSHFHLEHMVHLYLQHMQMRVEQNITRIIDVEKNRGRHVFFTFLCPTVWSTASIVISLSFRQATMQLQLLEHTCFSSYILYLTFPCYTHSIKEMYTHLVDMDIKTIRVDSVVLPCGSTTALYH